MRQLPITHLVWDLAGLCIPVIVQLGCLERAQHLQSAASELRIDQQVLQGDDQTVTAERGNEPGQARCGQEHHVVGAAHGQAQGRHVLERLMIEAIELFVAGADLEHRLQPMNERPGMAQLVALNDAVRGGFIMAIAVGQRI